MGDGLNGQGVCSTRVSVISASVCAWCLLTAGCATQTGEHPPESAAVGAAETDAATEPGPRDLHRYVSASLVHQTPLPGMLHLRLVELLNAEEAVVQEAEGVLRVRLGNGGFQFRAPLNERGLFHGVLRIVDAAGNDRFECGFDDGRPHGAFRAWDETGVLIAEEHWHFGVRDGSI